LNAPTPPFILIVLALLLAAGVSGGAVARGDVGEVQLRLRVAPRVVVTDHPVVDRDAEHAAIGLCLYSWRETGLRLIAMEGQHIVSQNFVAATAPGCVGAMRQPVRVVISRHRASAVTLMIASD